MGFPSRRRGNAKSHEAWLRQHHPDLVIRQELKETWRGPGHEARKTILSGKVWDIVARLLTDGSGPVYDIETECGVLQNEMEDNTTEWMHTSYQTAETAWRMAEKLASIPMEDLALNVNEENSLARFVMSARLSSKHCGEDESTCMCDHCPLREEK